MNKFLIKDIVHKNYESEKETLYTHKEIINMEQKILNNNTRVTTKRYLMVNEFLQSREVDTDY